MTYGLKEAHDELLSELKDLQDENARLRSCLSEDEENARLIIGEYNELREKYEEVCETSAMLRADMAAARERQAKLRDENAKLRELVIRADKLMQGVLDNADGTVVVSELPCCDTLLDNLEIYREDMRELGIEVEHERNHQ